MRGRRWGPATAAVHAGEALDFDTGAVTTPIYQTSTFAYPERPTRDGKWAPATWFYTRYANPTVASVEAKIARLEGAEACLAFSSGMAAMAAAVLAPLRTGDRVASMQGIYGGTQALLSQHVERLGFGVDVVASLDAGDLADAVEPSTRVLVTEIPTNPFNRVIDLPEVRRRLETRWGTGRPIVVTDATFATPIGFRPLENGADVSVHSATKYLNGHSDVIGGVASGKTRLLAPLESWRKYVGASMDPHQAYLLGRGVKTLEVRVRRAEQNAAKVAAALEAHRKVDAVWHLSLKSHPDYRLAGRLLGGPGAIVTLRLRGRTIASARRFVRALELFAPAPSLGGVESLVSLPIETSHQQASPAERRAQGITPTVVRLAVGIETASDLVADVWRGLRAV